MYHYHCLIEVKAFAFSDDAAPIKHKDINVWDKWNTAVKNSKCRGFQKWFQEQFTSIQGGFQKIKPIDKPNALGLKNPSQMSKSW